MSCDVPGGHQKPHQVGQMEIVSSPFLTAWHIVYTIIKEGLSSFNVVLYCFVVTMTGATGNIGCGPPIMANDLEDHTCAPEDLEVVTTWLPPRKQGGGENLYAL